MRTENNTEKALRVVGVQPSIPLTIVAGVILSLILLFLPFFFPPSGQTGPNPLAGIGRFHLLILHFPAALFPLILLFEIFKRLRPVVLPIIGTAVLSAFAASVLGVLLAANDGFSGELVVKHMWSCISATILSIFLFILKMLQQRTDNSALSGAYFILLFSTLGLLAFGSHQGASLVHGEGFLTEKFSLTKESADPITENSLVYDKLIQPILRDHCYHCHSVAKAKGGYRMDDFSLLLEGGDGGMPGIEPGNLEDSEVYYRITLAPDKKAFMPPAGHLPLTDHQIALIRWWIESGASMEASISTLLESHPATEVQALFDPDRPSN